MIRQNSRLGLVFWIAFTVFFLPISQAFGVPPTVVSKSPDDRSVGQSVNTAVTIQFDMTMDTGSLYFELEDEYWNEIDGTFSWSQTVDPDDTVTFTPDNTLRYGTHYWYGFTGQSLAGEGLDGGWYDVAFITEPSPADATPPTVQTVYPYNGMTGVSTTAEIFCVFSEAMDPSTITDSTITLAGSGISGPGDYEVDYEFEDGMVGIWKTTQMEPSSMYTVTITTGVKDAKGNSLASEYAWSFTTTGASDSTSPTVTQTIPAAGDLNVGHPLHPREYHLVR